MFAIPIIIAVLCICFSFVLIKLIMPTKDESVGNPAADPYDEFCIVDEHFVQFEDIFDTVNYEKRVVERCFSLLKSLW